MAVVLNSISSATAGTAAAPVSTVSGSVTVSGVYNRVLMVAVGWETKSGDPARTITTLTLNGDPLELCTVAKSEVGTQGGLTAACALAYFLGPASGAATLVCTMSGNVDHIEMAWGTAVDVVLQAPEVTTSVQGNTAGTAFLETPITPLTAGGMLLTAFAGNKEDTLTASGGQTAAATPVVVDAAAGQRLGFGREYNVTAAARTPRWTPSTTFNRAAMVAAVFAPAKPIQIGSPYISGSLQIGQTLTCHPGRHQYPATSFAYAWKKNGVANGTTTATYVTVAGDLGATITCTVTPTNGAGAGTAGTTPGVTPIAATTDKITTTDYNAGQIFQRVGTSASVQVTGTYANTVPNHIQVQVRNRLTDVIVLAWTTITSATIAGGNWTGVLAGVPQGGFYYHEVRSRDASNNVLATGQGGNPWAVGKLFGRVGSSTFNRWEDQPTAEAPSNLISVYNLFGTPGWTASLGAGDIAFGNVMLALEPGVPIGLLSYAVGGTKLNTGAGAGWKFTTDTDYAAACAGINGRKATTAQTYCLLEGLLLHIGSGDSQNNLIVSQASFESDYRTLLSNFRATAGSGISLGQSTLKVYIGGGQRKLGGGLTDLQFTWERAGELNVADDTNNYYIPGMTDLEICHDATHYTARQFAEHGRRAARTYGNVNGLTSLPYKGPKPASATYNAGTGKVTVTFTFTAGTGLATEDGVTTGIVGFRCSLLTDFSVLQTISAAVIGSNPQTVELTIPAGLTPPVYVDYATGANPAATRRLFDNSGSPP